MYLLLFATESNQVFAPGIAVNQAEVLGVDESVSIGLGNFDRILKLP